MTRLKAALLGSLFFATLGLGAQAGSKNIVEIAAGDSRFSVLVAALKAADLVDVLQKGSFTVFAPTNDAFGKLPPGTVERLLEPENKDELIRILSFHAVAGTGRSLSEVLAAGELSTVAGPTVRVSFKEGRVRVNDSELQTSDLDASNGTIHIIDSVLIPPSPVVKPKTLVDVAQENGSFTTLISAVKAAGLVEVLSGEGPFTVFAPTDAAFAKVEPEVLANLLKPHNRDQLAALLKFHVVAGEVSGGDALKAGKIKSILGASVPVSFKDGVLLTQWSKVLTLDVKASNGLIHVIDSVMLPPKFKIVSSKGPSECIVAAIDKGVPLYNGGDTAACAAVYMETSRTLLADHSLPRNVRLALHHGVRSAKQSACEDTQAWTLRRGLDQAYTMLRADR